MEYTKEADEFYSILEKHVNIDKFIEIQNIIESENFNQTFGAFMPKLDNNSKFIFLAALPKKFFKDQIKENIYIHVEFDNYHNFMYEELNPKIRLLHHKPDDDLTLQDYVNFTIYNLINSSNIQVERYQSLNN